jgi:hypothetical protein
MVQYKTNCEVYHCAVSSLLLHPLFQVQVFFSAPCSETPSVCVLRKKRSITPTQNNGQNYMDYTI